MKNLASLFLILAAFTVLPAFSYKVKVDVPGMKCAMCVHGMRKVFKDSVKNPETDVKVNLDTNTLTLDLTRPLSDEEIKSHVKNAGYNAKSIVRI